MHEVTASAEVHGSSADRVWELVSDAEAMSVWSDQVLRVLPQGTGPEARTSWTVLLNGSEVSWVQQETAHPPFLLAFTQVTGDLADLAGQWRIEPTSVGVRLELRITFHLGIDGLAPLFDPMWIRTFQAYADHLVRVLAQVAAGEVAR